MCVCVWLCRRISVTCILAVHSLQCGRNKSRVCVVERAAPVVALEQCDVCTESLDAAQATKHKLVRHRVRIAGVCHVSTHPTPSSLCPVRWRVASTCKPTACVRTVPSAARSAWCRVNTAQCDCRSSTSVVLISIFVGECAVLRRC
jgi:hypothetical protein